MDAVRLSSAPSRLDYRQSAVRSASPVEQLHTADGTSSEHHPRQQQPAEEGPAPFQFLKHQNSKFAAAHVSSAGSTSAMNPYTSDDPSPRSPFPQTPTTPATAQHVHQQPFYHHHQQQQQPLQQYGAHYAKLPPPSGYQQSHASLHSQLPSLHIPMSSQQQQQSSQLSPHPSNGNNGASGQASGSGSGSGSGVKRKRKSTSEQHSQQARNNDDDDDDGRPQLAHSSSSGNAAAAAAAASQQDAGGKKRTKTQRACDSCRTRKIRCDVLTDSEPALCHHCKQYGFECTFYLPITETRFKKKKLEDEPSQPLQQPIRPSASASAAGDDAHALSFRRTASPRPERVETKVYGPTFLPFLMHSTSTVPKSALSTYDLRHNHKWEVSHTGDGFIHVTDPGPSEGPEYRRPIAAPVNTNVLNSQLIQYLVNSYFDNMAPLFPVISRHDFVGIQPNPPPLLLYSICIVAASQRDVPREVFDALRSVVNRLIREDDVLSTSSTTSVQALLVLGMCSDAHGTYAPLAVTALWQRVGAAIRQAQDLGLQRAEAVTNNIEVRRRVWGACVISDRWCSLTYGQPFMIDVQDCDARLPSSADSRTPLPTAEYMYMCELIKLSILLGRVLKMIYSPSGLTQATDEGLHSLLDDLDAWKGRLPALLVFTGPDSSIHAGLLHLLYSCVLMIFWRVFMRISYSCPAHLKFALRVERWTALVHISRESIEWLDRNERMYDTWLLVAYAATSCALVQFHTWTRRRDPEAQQSLCTLHDCVKRWEDKVGPDHMPVRRRTSEVISLLYKLTLKPPSETGQQQEPHLNPTRGVMARAPDAIRGLTFHKDASRAGGGVYIAPDTSITSQTLIKENIDAVVPPEEMSGGVSDLNGASVKLEDAAGNVNPDLNATTQNVQVLNMLSAQNDGVERVTVSEQGLLEGLPQHLNWEGLSFDNFFTNGLFHTGFASFNDNSLLGQLGGLGMVGVPPVQGGGDALLGGSNDGGQQQTFGPPYTVQVGAGLYPPGANSHVDVNGHGGGGGGGGGGGQ